MSSDQGAPAIDARIVIGAIIVKHKLRLDDREAIETIRENTYIQYFLGLEEYTYKDVFDRSLFTTLRYRLGVDKFDAMTGEIIRLSEGKSEREVNDRDDSASSGNLLRKDQKHQISNQKKSQGAIKEC
jgi:transposase, IS5 family